MASSIGQSTGRSSTRSARRRRRATRRFAGTAWASRRRLERAFDRSRLGEVVSANQLGTYGLTVIVDHGGGDYSIYGSLARSDVRAQQTVIKGQQLGSVGISDPDLAPHLHFEIRHGTDGRPVAIDPAKWLKDPTLTAWRSLAFIMSREIAKLCTVCGRFRGLPRGRPVLHHLRPRFARGPVFVRTGVRLRAERGWSDSLSEVWEGISWQVAGIRSLRRLEDRGLRIEGPRSGAASRPAAKKAPALKKPAAKKTPAAKKVGKTKPASPASAKAPKAATKRPAFNPKTDSAELIRIGLPRCGTTICCSARMSRSLAAHTRRRRAPAPLARAQCRSSPRWPIAGLIERARATNAFGIRQGARRDARARDDGARLVSDQPCEPRSGVASTLGT